jgi:hypothetical protein
MTSSPSLRWLHVRLRLAGFRMRGLRKANAPAGLRETPKCFEIGAREDWRGYLKRLDERLMSPDAQSCAPVAKTIAGVMTYGLNQLDAAHLSGNKPDVAASGQGPDGMVGDGLASPDHGDGDFVERWADAMCREMGAEEIEKLGLAMREADHGTDLK